MRDFHPRYMHAQGLRQALTAMQQLGRPELSLNQPTYGRFGGKIKTLPAWSKVAKGEPDAFSTYPPEGVMQPHRKHWLAAPSGAGLRLCPAAYTRQRPPITHPKAAACLTSAKPT